MPSVAAGPLPSSPGLRCVGSHMYMDMYRSMRSILVPTRPRGDHACDHVELAQAGIINPAELAPIASIYLAVWVAIGGRGRLYGAVIGAALISLLSSAFTGGQVPDLPLGFATLQWVDWWTVFLGFGFVLVTLYTPQGLGGLMDRLVRKEGGQ